MISQAVATPGCSTGTLQVALQQFDDVQHADLAALHVDRVGAGIVQEHLLGQPVDLVRRELADVLPFYRQPLQPQHLEARIGEVAIDDAGVLEVVADADELLDAERFERAHLV